MRIKSKVLIAATAAILLVGVGSSTAWAGQETSEATDSDVVGLVESANLAGPALVSGVLSRDSRPAEAGTQVTVYAWPSGDSLSRLQIGDAVKKYPVGYAHTGDDGKFEVRVSDDSQLGRYSDKQGTVNFEVVGFDSAGPYIGYFTADEAQAFGRQSGPTDVKVEALRDVEPRFEEPALAPDGGAIDKACTTVKRADLGNVWATVGYGYISASGVTMKFEYTNSSTSTLGVGTSSSGAAGTYSASGTSTTTSSGTVTYPSTNSFKAWKTQFRYGKYETNCVSGGTGVYIYYTARSDGWSGGSSISTVSGAPAASYCTNNAAGTTFTKSNSTAYESSVGASTSGLLGVNLSARTGYTSTTKITFTFASAAKLCGTNDVPGGSPQRLVAKP